MQDNCNIQFINVSLYAITACQILYAKKHFKLFYILTFFLTFFFFFFFTFLHISLIHKQYFLTQQLADGCNVKGVICSDTLIYIYIKYYIIIIITLFI